MVYGDTNWKDKLTGYDSKAITYDAIGNPLTYDGWTYTWEAGRQLASMSKAGQSLSFKYNDAGIRTRKTVNGVTTNYYLNGDKVTLEDNGTDQLYYSYDAAGNLVSMNLNGIEYYYIRNAEGDIIGLFDDAGTQVVGYTYDSWGKLITTTGSLASTVGAKNPYLYRGYRFDSETGLYYLQSRYYSPEWGRFINADSHSGYLGVLLSSNVFAYCRNNPVNMSDPYGYYGYAISLGSTFLLGAEAVLGFISSPAVLIGVGIIGIGILAYEGYQYYKSETSNEIGQSSESKPQVFPENPSEMDKVLKVPGEKVKDGPTTQGRNKTKWRVSDDITVTHEQHPYDLKAPDFHKKPHYHVDSPEHGHTRFLPGDKLPDIFK